ncbi:cotamer alpha, putative [Trichomonas vaginalis G3]|uniref:Cotamer alpha, putative n=1 Tax=Trichomonas vaginalis (strain ATCC PRA-98 / G3) TaxID=412133 RepID=A2DDS5_TRIV3|nr:coatomer family [Trichomonas vaginalis G3]EAY21451.1 cotamer alpha, putative [Trichomonas vaginalis G3]KAI5490664.1 coatomer family [Trichomonas vaginalis G3]|eukprot:XP_001582437.1 cotamer alpha [Trichomonas vaginalis G3]
MKVKIDIEAPRVKGICFHPSRPWVLYSTHTGMVVIYDYDINVELQSYQVSDVPVRCVAFHSTQPLFACGTDDYQVIVYNWQRKVKLFTLEGHIDFIRSIEFHSTYPLLITSSDDSTSRIWNWQSRCCVCILEDHTYFVMSSSFNPNQPLVATACLDECVRLFSIENLLKGSMSKDVDSSFFSLESNSSLLSESEEHPEGANCVAWDSSGNRLISCGEDSSIKVYKIINDELQVTSTINAHTGPATCVRFHPATGNIISCSEDFSIREFDGNTYREIGTYEISGSRFWCVAAHPKDALIAAGHDSGVTILKTNKERTPFDVQGTSVAWIQESEIHVVDVISKNQEKPSTVQNGVTSISWNNARNMALVSYDNEKNPYYQCIDLSMTNPITKGEGLSAVWFSRSSFVCLSTSRDKLCYGEPGSSTLSRFQVPHALRLFAAPAQRVYLVTKTNIYLYDITRQKEIRNIQFNDCKVIMINDDKTKICARNSTSILYSNADLTDPSVFNESSKVKSCCFDGDAILFTTRTHLKYIVSGYSGVVCSLPRVLYIIKAKEEIAWFVTRDGVVFKREIELGELKLKLALINSKSDGGHAARRIVAEQPPIGFAIMEFAANNNRYDIAASLARDPKTKFEMALKAGDFDTAVLAADEIKDKSIYKTLAENALNCGKISLAEKMFTKANDTENLAFLYLLAGNSASLQKLTKQTNNPEYMIWCNDNESIDKLLIGINPNLEQIVSQKMPEIELPEIKQRSEDWPLTRPTFIPFSVEKDTQLDEGETEWPMSDEDDNQKSDNNEEDDSEGWDVDINVENIPAPSPSQFVAPPRGEDIKQEMSKNSTTIGDFAASGDFGEALVLAKTQLNAKNFEPLKNLFIESFVRSNLSIQNEFGHLSVPLSMKFRNLSLPVLTDSVSQFDEMMKNSIFIEFNKGHFKECFGICQTLIRRVIVTSVQTKEEEQKILDCLHIATKYAIGCLLELTRKSETDPTRNLELAVYFTHVGLARSHERLTLQSAVRMAMKYHNYLTAKSLISRLLDLEPNEKIAGQARASLEQANKVGTNALNINYNERNPFFIDVIGKTPIYRGKPSISCPLCGCQTDSKNAGQLCPICEICEFGGQPTGLKILRTIKQ